MYKLVIDLIARHVKASRLCFSLYTGVCPGGVTLRRNVWPKINSRNHFRKRGECECRCWARRLRNGDATLNSRRTPTPQTPFASPGLNTLVIGNSFSGLDQASCQL
jgi:hypothetical protein